jgi:hypothetical protein
VELFQTEFTGCRLVGAITKELGHNGPKHHTIILGENFNDGETYIAESMNTNYQVSTYGDFQRRYSSNGEIIVAPNDGETENVSLANRAIREINEGGKGKYNLLTNNCECFVNRAIMDKSVSRQTINTALGIVALVGLVYVIRNSK